MEKQIYKRTGQLVDFDPQRIQVAIAKAVEATPDHGLSLPTFAETISKEVNAEIEFRFFEQEKTPSIEDVQDIEIGRAHV